MNEIHFLDESSFINWLDRSQSPKTDIENLIDIADSIFDRNIDINASSQLDCININSNLCLYDLYQENEFGIDRDSALRFSVFRRKLITHDVNHVANAELKNENGTSIKVIDNWYSAYLLNEIFGEQNLFGLLMIGSQCAPEQHSLINEDNLNTVFPISHVENISRYFRSLILKCAKNETDFFHLWNLAFPNCIKSDNLTFGRFRGSYSTLLNPVLEHLSFINDNYQQISAICNNNFPEIIDRSSATFRINLSNESTKTRNSIKKMQQRVAHFSGQPATCECHTKISPQFNRIHFRTPIANIAEGKMLVGIFVDHLDV